MSILDIINTAWPILLGFITLVIVLAKMHTAIEVLQEKVSDEVGARLLDLPASFRKPVEKYIASDKFTEEGLEQILKSHEDPMGSHFMSWLSDLIKKDKTALGSK